MDQDTLKKEIKFRAWDKIERILCTVEVINLEKGCFLNGNSATPDTYYDRMVVEGPKQGHFVDFNRLELMQYTGLKDKNGVEIYEADIVSVDNSDPVDRGEYDITTVCKWDKGGFILEDHAGGQWTRQLFHQPDRLTVVGNIFQNPELLTP